MLRLEQIQLSFNDTPLFQPLSLNVKGGEIAVLSAPSGAGKTTLLRWIAGIGVPGLAASGRVWLHEQCIDGLPAEQRRIGLMFQEPLLFPHLSVADNLGFGLSAKIRGTERRSEIERALEACGMAGMGKRDPETLSGGQKTRIALLRTLLSQPQALLLDEPFSSLDDKRREQIIGMVRSQADNRGLPVLLVSHDPRDEALAGTNVMTLHS